MMVRRAIACLVFGGVGVACDPPPPEFTEPMTLGGEVVKPQVLEQGKRLYVQYCGTCHGTDGSGTGPAAASLKTKPRDFRVADFDCGNEPGRLPTHEQLVEVIVQGRADRDMPAWKGLRPEDVDALAHYVKTFSVRWQP